MARCPTCRHDTGDPTIEMYECAICHRIWCDACGPACRHVNQAEPRAFVLSDDAYL